MHVRMTDLLAVTKNAQELEDIFGGNSTAQEMLAYLNCRTSEKQADLLLKIRNMIVEAARLRRGVEGFVLPVERSNDMDSTEREEMLRQMSKFTPPTVP